MAASANALVLFVSVASDASASFVARPSVRRPRLARSKTTEETMKIYSITELMRLTRAELCALLNQIAATLPTFREGSPQRTAAYINLRNIRAILARRDFSP
jgi:hypothetical protein